MAKGYCQSVIWGIFFCMFFMMVKAAHAGQSSGILPVSTQVTANCSLSSATLNFGNYDPIGANATASLSQMTTFQVACTKGANVTITLNNGLNSGNAVGTTRAMSDGGGHYLSYELYNDPARSAIWNQANPIVFVAPASTPLTRTVYGKVPAGQNQVTGNYSDTVTVTATF